MTPRIRALADRLADGKPPWRAVETFWSHMVETLCSGYLHYDAFRPADALDWVLDHGWFDCLTGAALMAALCRARGLPARLVGGHFLCRHYPSFHNWVEVWIDGDGWRPVDTYGWDLSAGGADLAWRDHFLGRQEFRMVTHRPPLRFAGAPGMRVPTAIHAVSLYGDGVLTTTTHDIATDALVHTDRIWLAA